MITHEGDDEQRPRGESNGSKPIRRGLVLQGGGAKGAFQYGVIKVLHENGVRFDVISGTSVGALNGAIVATDSWDLGDELWGQLSLRSIFTWSGLSLAVSLLTLLGRLYYSYLSGFYEKAVGLWLRVVFHTLTIIPAAAIIVALVVLPTQSYGSAFYAAVLCTVGVVGVVSRPALRRLTFHSYYTLLLLLPPGLLLVSAIAAPSRAVDHIFTAVLTSLLVLSSYPIQFVLLFGSSVLYTIGVRSHAANLHVLNNQPLLELVSRVTSRRFQVPMLATSSEEVPSYYDPDNFDYLRVHARVGFFDAVPSIAMKPVYERIDTLPAEQAALLLVASTALPLGVAPATTLASGARRVDGGVIDNTPWFPVIDRYACDEVVIVLCGPPEQDAIVDIREWQERDRFLRVIEKAFEPPRARARTPFGSPTGVHNRPPSVIPYRDAPSIPARIIVVAPEKRLGNFLTATINFSAARARANMAAGQIAAAHVLAAIG